MQRLSPHPNFVSGFAYYANPSRGKGYLIMEKIDGNNLLDIVMQYGPLEGITIISSIKQLIEEKCKSIMR
jgi:serine/threonine protein kinase